MSTPRHSTVTIELDAALHKRLCEAAAGEGVDVPGFCRNAIERELGGGSGTVIGGARSFDIDDLLAYRDRLLGDQVFPGDSADIIREAREARTKQMDEWR